MYYQHEWSEEEIRDCYRQAYDENCPDCAENSNRFGVGGLLLPFIGGLIVGGLFIPKPNSYQYPPYQQPMQYQYPVYYPPYPQTANVPPYPGQN